MGAAKSSHRHSLTEEEENHLKQYTDGIITEMLDGNKNYGDTTIVPRDGLRLYAHRNVLLELYDEDRFYKTGEDEYVVRDDNRESKVLKELLRYRYLHKVENLPEVARELLLEAHNFQCVKLKELCGDSLAEIVDVENAVELLVLAKTYEVVGLECRAKQFVLENLDKLSWTPEFVALKESQPSLWQELMISINSSQLVQESEDYMEWLRQKNLMEQGQ